MLRGPPRSTRTDKLFPYTTLFRSDRAKQLFNCSFVNVQPHSGAQANGAVMLALTKPGDTIMGLSLDAGGHLTHGAKAAMSGKWFNAVQYGVREDTHLIDYEAGEKLARRSDERREGKECVRTGRYRWTKGH